MGQAETEQCVPGNEEVTRVEKAKLLPHMQQKAETATELRELADRVERGDSSVFFVEVEPTKRGTHNANWCVCLTSKVAFGFLTLAGPRYVRKLEEYELEGWE